MAAGETLNFAQCTLSLQPRISVSRMLMESRSTDHDNFWCVEPARSAVSSTFKSRISISSPFLSDITGIAFRPSRNEVKASSPWKVIPIEELMTGIPPLDRERVHGHFSNLCRLKSTLALVTYIPMPPEPRCLKPALNIAGCLALLHAIHLAEAHRKMRRRI
jgi:hypothetical protein